MYIQTNDSLGQPPKPKPKAYKVLTNVQTILRAMRQNPKQWEPSLLETMLHPFPWQLSTPLWKRLFEWTLLENEDPEKIANEIRKIGKRHLWSQAFAKRYQKGK